MATNARVERPFVPPQYTIDLSLPPRERYKTLAAVYKTQLTALTGLFDELLIDLALPPTWLPTINRFSKLLLRKVHDTEQTQELRGIFDETGIPMYLLISFNVVLDLLMGCTSGAARSRETNQNWAESRMLHFRTLDWTMNPLRKIVVHLDFVRSKSPSPSTVIASSITYVGFTGVLTGVKPGLSMSLNFRAVHNAKTKSAHFRFYFHHVLVLLGQRPSIASLLRHHLIGEAKMPSKYSSDLATVASDLQSQHTTAAYIILSDGNSTVTMEKDYATAKLRQSTSFIAITNHDKGDHDEPSHPTPVADASKSADLRKSSGLEDIIEESTERLHCIQGKWDAKVKRAQRARRKPKSDGGDDPSAKDVSVTRRELVRWLSEWPTTNECTHYSAILDPSIGKVVWARAHPCPLQQPGVHG